MTLNAFGVSGVMDFMPGTLNAFGIVLCILWALSALLTITMIGKPRPMTTHKSAVFSVVQSTMLIVLLLVFGTGKL